jgi:hypothetical protein
MSDDAKDAERRRKLEELEQRVFDLIQEDLRKDIPSLLTDIHEESLKNKGVAISPITRTLARFASLLGALYVRADIQTRRIIRLTQALVFLTIVLLIFTIYLSYDAYLNDQRAKQERKHQTEKHEPLRRSDNSR